MGGAEAMDAIAKLKEELEAKKRKVDALAGKDAASSEGAAESAPAKKKVYRTNGQTKQLLKEMQVSVSSASESTDGGRKLYSRGGYTVNFNSIVA